MENENNTQDPSGTDGQNKDELNLTPDPSGTDGQPNDPKDTPDPSGTDGQNSEEKARDFDPNWLKDRLDRARAQERRKVEADFAEKERLAKLSAEEQAKEATKAAEAKAQAAEARAKNAERKVELLGDFQEVDSLLKLIGLEEDSDSFFLESGKPDIEAISKAFPLYVKGSSNDDGLETPNLNGGKHKNESQMSDEEFFASKTKSS